MSTTMPGIRRLAKFLNPGIKERMITQTPKMALTQLCHILFHLLS